MRIKKVSQTIPVQAHLTNVYTESTQDGYSANYINGLHEYSMTEQRVGTWINGKPIYRKVISTTGYATEITANIGAVVDNIINVTGMVKRGDYPNIYMHIPSRSIESQYMSDFGNIQFNTTNNSIKVTLNFGSGIQNMIGTAGVITIILEYTKAKD